MDIANIVTLQDLEINIDLAAFALSLGFECVEYEPEQFPGLVYKPSNYSTTALVFASGKVIVTGSDELSTSKEVHSLIESLLTEEFNK
jgi:transcription initiation factor TFIID TATA-box-binding protein